MTKTEQEARERLIQMNHYVSIHFQDVRMLREAIADTKTAKVIAFFGTELSEASNRFIRMVQIIEPENIPVRPPGTRFSITWPRISNMSYDQVLNDIEIFSRFVTSAIEWRRY
jgi:hypothetical protein